MRAYDFCSANFCLYSFPSITISSRGNKPEPIFFVWRCNSSLWSFSVQHNAACKEQFWRWLKQLQFMKPMLRRNYRLGTCQKRMSTLRHSWPRWNIFSPITSKLYTFTIIVIIFLSRKFVQFSRLRVALLLYDDWLPHSATGSLYINRSRQM